MTECKPFADCERVQQLLGLLRMHVPTDWLWRLELRDPNTGEQALFLNTLESWPFRRRIQGLSDD